MEKLDSKRYGFDKKTQHWEESKKRSSKEFHIPESIGRIRYGKDLDLHFESIKISSRSRDQNLENVVYVQTMQKYVPVITITNLASKETVAHVVLEMAQFIPVTIYQDQSIGKWKAQHNKYATVRYGGKGMEQKKKEKTQEPILEDNSNFRLDPISRVLEVDKILNSSSPVNAVPQVCSQYPMMPQNHNIEQYHYPAIRNNYSTENKENQTDILNLLETCHEADNLLNSSKPVNSVLYPYSSNPMTSQENNSYQYTSMMNNSCYTSEMTYAYLMNYN